VGVEVIFVVWSVHSTFDIFLMWGLQYRIHERIVMACCVLDFALNFFFAGYEFLKVDEKWRVDEKVFVKELKIIFAFGMC
jgi:hypothetical protein